MPVITKKTAAAGAGGVAALGGGTYGIVKATESGDTTVKSNTQKIKDVLSEDLLPTDGSDFTNEWKSLAEKLIKETSLSEDLNQIKTEENKSSNKGEKLKSWCKSQGDKFSKESELLSLVKKWCIYTIENKKTEGELANFSETGSDREVYVLKEKLERFNPENDLITELKKLKESEHINDNEAVGGEFKKACQEIYKRGYTGENGKVWTQFKSFCYKPTIEDKLWDVLLPEGADLNEDWSKKHTTAKTSEIDEVKTAADKEAIKKWCKEQYPKRYDTSTKGNKKLLNEVKRLCSLTIKEKLDEDSGNKKSLSVLDDTNQNEWTTNAKKLHSEPINSTQKNETIESIKLANDGNDANGKNWQTLKNQCSFAYEMGYKGQNDELWKVVEKYCTKPTVDKK